LLLTGAADSSHEVSRRALRLPRVFARPAFVLAAALAIHAMGRVSATCAPSRFDSFVYSVAAYRFYDPQATAADLVPDKPAGQPCLTGWMYRVMPAPPSRLTLLPLDSAFLLAGYALFWLLARGLADRTAAAAGMLFLVLGINAYNTLYEDVAGLNVNEIYLLAPMLLAVWAHLAVQRPAWRGLLRGVGLGLALSVKQSAVGLAVVLVVCGLLRAAEEGRVRDIWRGVAWSAFGMAVVWVPPAVLLYVRGWLGPHLADLASRSGEYVELAWPRGWHGYRFAPVAATAWWAIVGLVLGTSCRTPTESRGRQLPLEHDAARLAWLWLAVEVTLLWLMTRRSGHYHQQVVAPAALLAVIGMARMARLTAFMSLRQRLRARYLAACVTVVLVLVALMPFTAEIWRRVPGFSYDEEVRTFAAWLADWSPRSLAPHWQGR